MPLRSTGSGCVTDDLTAREVWDARDAQTRAAGLAILRRQDEVRMRTDRVIRRTLDLEAIGKGPRPIALEEAVAPLADVYLVEHLIRPGTITMLAGPPGSAKSFLSRQLALASAAGLADFLGHYAITRRLAVGIVDEDNGEAEEYRREVGLLDHLGVLRSDVEGSFRISHAGVRLDHPDWQQWLRALIEEYRLDLLILDPVSEMHDGDELRKDMRPMLRFLKELRRDFPNLAIVLVHHTRKPAPADRAAPRTLEDVRGQWGQSPDVIVLVSPLGERRYRWEVHKRVPYSALILEQLNAGAVGKIADETTATRRQASTDDRVLAAIDAGAESAEQVQVGTGIPERTVWAAIRRLRRARILTPKGAFDRALEGAS
jgi:hypothetical protein